MKNEYNKKKRIAIITLSALAVCLAGGLFWYMGTLGNTQPPVATAENLPETTVAVVEIRPENTAEPVTAAPESTPEPETEPESTSEPMAEPMREPASGRETEPEHSTEAGTPTGNVQAKPSEGKPKTPEQAAPPAEPPRDMPESVVPVENPDTAGQCQPEHTPQPEAEQPQGGEKQNGQIYVPGFGWIEDYGGGSEVHEAPNAGTGKPVGEM